MAIKKASSDSSVKRDEVVRAAIVRIKAQIHRGDGLNLITKYKRKNQENPDGVLLSARLRFTIQI